MASGLAPQSSTRWKIAVSNRELIKLLYQIVVLPLTLWALILLAASGPVPSRRRAQNPKRVASWAIMSKKTASSLLHCEQIHDSTGPQPLLKQELLDHYHLLWNTYPSALSAMHSKAAFNYCVVLVLIQRLRDLNLLRLLSYSFVCVSQGPGRR